MYFIGLVPEKVGFSNINLSSGDKIKNLNSSLKGNILSDIRNKMQLNHWRLIGRNNVVGQTQSLDKTQCLSCTIQTLYYIRKDHEFQ